MRPSNENLVGQLLDNRYQIEQKLDAGGISAVYLARDLRLIEKKVVVKVLLEESYKNEYVVTKFRQEIEALARLRHPNIVDILDSGTLPDGMPYIVLEFIKGSSLRSLIRPEGGDLYRAAHIVRQAASALTAAHENGILHRDLKPENIMLRQLDDGEEQVKVIDFGIAKIENSVVAPETAVVATAGTIAYMSPEQLSAAKLSPASDIFSLGVVAYELLTGQKPFTPKTPFQLLEMHRAGVNRLPRDLRPAVSETAQMVLLKALAFDPAERYLKAREFGDDLFESLTGLPGRTGRLAPPGPSRQRRDDSPDATSVYATTPAQQMPPTPPPQQTQGPTAQTDPDGPKRSTAEVRAGDDARTAAYAATGEAPPREPGPQVTTAMAGGTQYAVQGGGAQYAVIPPAPAQRGKGRLYLTVAGVLLGALVVAGVAVALAWKYWGGMRGSPANPVARGTSEGTDATTPAPESPRPAAEETGFSYSLTVQRVRDGRPFGEPFESSGQRVLENEWRVRLNISGGKDGYIYLINEGLNETGQTELVLLFPNNLTNNGSARLTAGQTLRTPPPPQYFELSGKPETEKVWIIWSGSALPELEAVRDAVYAPTVPRELMSEITDAGQQEAVRRLFARYDPARVKAAEDAELKRTDVRGEGDVVVYLARLQHE